MNLNYDAMSEFVTLGFVLGEDTFRNEEKSKRLIKIHDFETDRKSTINDVEESLKNSIEKFVKNKKNIAIHLSGGKDTRLVVALAKSLGIDFTAVTIGEKNCVDIKLAKQITKELKLKHVIHILKLEETFTLENINEFVTTIDGLLPFDFLDAYIINKKLSKQFDCFLTGDMMSEIMDTWDFKNYPKEPLNDMKKRWGYYPVVKNKYITSINKKLKDMYSNKSLEYILFDTTVKNTFLKGIEFYICNNINYHPIVFEKEVLSNIYSLNITKRRNCYLSKKIIKNNNKELLKIPYSYSGYNIPLYYPYIIHQILRKIHSHGKEKYFGSYVNINRLKDILNNTIEDKIKTFDIDIIEQKTINKLLKNEEYFTPVKRLFTLKIWLENN